MLFVFVVLSLFSLLIIFHTNNGKKRNGQNVMMDWDRGVKSVVMVIFVFQKGQE